MAADRKLRGVAATDAERFWDERAREHALFFVDNRLDYRGADAESFWAGGVEALDGMLGAVDVAVGPEDVVVDIGCGVGRLTRVLAGRARRVVAVDVSAEMLARARALSPGLANVEWGHGDGRGLTGIGDGSVDGCLSHVVFQHIPDPAVTLGYVREIGRVLRPGGWALFQVSTDPSVHRPPGRLASLVRRRRERAWWGSAVDPRALRTAARDGGLEIVRLE